MRTSVVVTENTTAADLALGRSAVRRRILVLLMAEPERRLHLRELQRRAGTSPGTASRELGRLVAAGLVGREAEGHQVYFRATSSPFAIAVRNLILVATEPDPGPMPLSPADPESADLRSDLRHLKPHASAPEPPSPPRVVQTRPSELNEPKRPDALGLKVAESLARILRPIYGERLVGLYLYGSRAHGESKADADVEVLIVLDAIERYGDELERSSAACASLSLEFGLIVSRVFVSGQTWSNRTDGHLMAIRSDVVSV